MVKKYKKKLVGEKMSKKRKNIIALIIILLIALLISTYAIDSFPLQQTVFSKILRIDENAYGITEFDSTQLDLRPIIDQNVESNLNNVISINFYVGGNKANNETNIVYDIALVDLEVDCDLLSPYLKWKLIKNGEEISRGSFDYQFDTITNGRLVLTTIQQDLKDYNEDKSTYDYYQFYIWLSDSCQSENILDCLSGVEDQSSLLNKKLKGKIEVELYAKGKEMLVRKPSDTLHVDTCNSRNGDIDD